MSASSTYACIRPTQKNFLNLLNRALKTCMHQICYRPRSATRRHLTPWRQFSAGASSTTIFSPRLPLEAGKSLVLVPCDRPCIQARPGYARIGFIPTRPWFRISFSDSVTFTYNPRSLVKNVPLGGTVQRRKHVQAWATPWKDSSAAAWNACGSFAIGCGTLGVVSSCREMCHKKINCPRPSACTCRELWSPSLGISIHLLRPAEEAKTVNMRDDFDLIMFFRHDCYVSHSFIH